ncbi:MAG: hypothetical protein AAF726_06625 [Planctomycetota bacterium]
MKLPRPSLWIPISFGFCVLLLSGCWSSRKAPAHVFSGPEVEQAELPFRLRNSAEHDVVRAEFGEPYVLEFEGEGEGGALLYFGGSHSQSRSDPQLDDIRRRWSAFGPTVALCEGRQSRHVYGFLVEPFAGLPEPTLVHKLARANDVRLVSLEPDYEQEVRAQLQRFSAEEVALYYFLRVYASESGGKEQESLAKHLLAKRTDVEGLRGSLASLADVDRAWKTAYPNGEDWRVLAQEPTDGVLAQVSANSRRVRGEHMVRVLVDLTQQGERAFAVVGSGHVIRQEWALRALLGMPEAPDTPNT